MKSLIVASVVVAAGLCSGCQYGGDLLVYYLIDGGVGDSGTLLDGGDADTDSDTDSEDLDGGAGDAGCECMAGPCCSNGCDFDRPEDHVLCDTAVLYRCIGLCGAAQVEQMLPAERYCDGTSDTCTGAYTGVWEVVAGCSADQRCETSSFGLAGSCKYCPSGCDTGTEFCNL